MRLESCNPANPDSDKSIRRMMGWPEF